jgi:hypothetical protein
LSGLPGRLGESLLERLVDPRGEGSDHTTRLLLGARNTAEESLDELRIRALLAEEAHVASQEGDLLGESVVDVAGEAAALFE